MQKNILAQRVLAPSPTGLILSLPPPRRGEGVRPEKEGNPKSGVTRRAWRVEKSIEWVKSEALA